VLVLAIETSTSQTAVALGTEQGIVGGITLAMGRPGDEAVVPSVEHLLRWTESSPAALSGIAVGLGPGLFTGMRVGIATGKALAQSLHIPIVGLASLDVIAFSVAHTRRPIAAVVDARRGELFYAFYRPVPGGVTRESGFEVGPPERLAAELEARREDILMVGNGALAYRRVLEAAGTHVEFAPAAYAFPAATELVELAIARLSREDFDRVHDLKPYYVRKSDAQIAWDHRRRTG
jgi:tRNA threonylcarbamoyladenosine biosynthesis protein TsaB